MPSVGVCLTVLHNRQPNRSYRRRSSLQQKIVACTPWLPICLSGSQRAVQREERKAEEIKPDLQGFLFGPALSAIDIGTMSSTTWPLQSSSRTPNAARGNKSALA
jgi:hypothetical protein